MSLMGRLFNRKASAAGAAIAQHYVGRATWTPRQYDHLSREGFQKNVIAYKAVSAVARGVARVPWVLMGGAKGDVEVEDHPLLDLLKRPNPLQGGAALFEALTAFRLLSGNGYLEAVSGMGSQPVELWAHRPDRMKVVPGESAIPIAYEYTVGGMKPTRWDCDAITGQGPILHWKAFNPLNDWYGQSPIEAAAFAIDQHNEAGAWNKALLENSGRPSGVLTYAPKEGAAKLANDQFARLKGQLDEQYAGASKAGKIMLLDGGLAWTAMSMSPVDMDFLDGKDSSARDIAQAFGVPPQLLGIKGDSTYSNQAEARQALWQDTIIPLLDDLCDCLNNWLLPMYSEAGDAGKLALRYDVDEVPALEPSRAARWTAVSTATFLTTNEKREAVGYDKVDNPAADEVLIQSTLVPLGTEPLPAAPAIDPATGEPIEPDPTEKPKPGDKPEPATEPAADDEADMAKSLRAQGMSAKTAAELARLAYGDVESAD